MEIGKRLVDWFLKNGRDLPWRNNENPYQIWVSEIILQQTRVEQGLPYFFKFLNIFPDVFSLAQASDDQLFQVWQGLGYYSRAKNLRKAAQIIVEKFNGKIPHNEADLISLPGIGPYTVSAIRAFAFHLPDVALDGNALRVASRIYGWKEPIDSLNSKRSLKSLLLDELPKNESHNFNQALIELGALVCKPTHPSCEICPISTYCEAYRLHLQDQLPQKKQKIKAKTWHIHFLVIENGSSVALSKRGESGVWNHLYEFPSAEMPLEFSAETDQKKAPLKAIDLEEIQDWEPWFKPLRKLKFKGTTQIKHQLTHRNIEATFWHFWGSPSIIAGQKGIFEVELQALEEYPVHRLMEKYLEQYFRKIYHG